MTAKAPMALLFADLHAQTKKLSQLIPIVKENPDIKLLLFAGDALNDGEPVWFIDRFIDVIKEIGLPFIWVPGNHDFGRGFYHLQKFAKSIEGRVEEHFGRRFTGVGGSPASWAGQYQGEKMINKKEIAGTIFLSHVSPPGVLNWQKDDLFSPTSDKKFSDAPLVHICAHLHYRFGTAFLGQTKVVRLASFETGHYAIMNLDNLKVEFKRCDSNSLTG